LSSLDSNERGDLPATSGVSPDDILERLSSGPPRAISASEPVRDRVWLHVLLLLLTFATTTMAGSLYYLNYITDIGVRPVRVSIAARLLHGMWFSLTALTILGAHEMGHYIACRYYGINASLPYFIPFLPFPFGTLGAVIRIRQLIRTKRVLFDVGVAGPIAGFVLLVPALILGMYWSRVVRVPPVQAGNWEFGEPLLFKIVEWLAFGPIPKGYDVNLHPMTWAAWLGMLATALNLLPIGQLDGGHLAYANLGKRAHVVSYAALAIVVLIGLSGSANWLVYGLLLLAMLWLFGWQHPPVVDEDVPLDRGRVLVTVFAIIMFLLCFTPMPITQH
jgi:membrane-associated protease RseP (regulator of RpoE activity)